MGKQGTSLLLRSVDLLSANWFHFQLARSVNTFRSPTCSNIIMKIIMQFPDLSALLFIWWQHIYSESVGFSPVGMCIYWAHPASVHFGGFFRARILNGELQWDIAVIINQPNIPTGKKSKYDLIWVKRLLKNWRVISFGSRGSLYFKMVVNPIPSLMIFLQYNDNTEGKSNEASITTMMWQLNS